MKDKFNEKEVEKMFLDAVFSACLTGKEIVESEVVNETPVDTGTLRNGIASDCEMVKKDIEIRVGVKESSRARDYAEMVEKGTKFQEGQYYIQRGTENSLRDLEEYIIRQLNKKFN